MQKFLEGVGLGERRKMVDGRGSEGLGFGKRNGRSWQGACSRLLGSMGGPFCAARDQPPPHRAGGQAWGSWSGWV